MSMSRNTILLVTYVITGFYSSKWIGSCSEVSKQNYSGKDLFNSTPKRFENESVYLEHSKIPENISFVDDYLNVEPLTSDPVFEDTSWNSSALKEPNRRRDLPKNGLSHELKMEILQLHNLYRSNVTPAAGNMEYMEWDEELAILAQMWTDGCLFDHGMPENDYPETIGQNLYIGTDPTGYLGLWMWYEEYHNYDLRKQYCFPNKQCGHYVQMAWAASNKLGCGMTQCGMRYYLACHYSPQALRGVQMYRVGKPCSQCSSRTGALCLKNLCMNWNQCKQNPFECQFARCELECLNCGRLDKKNCLCECSDGWDSPDCSRLCIDKHARCGKNPGWPTKSTCSLNRHAVAETYCRKMCEMCNPYDAKLSNDTCCNGMLCTEGFVLETRDKSCKCSLLCPGPMCDNEEEGEIQASLQGSDCSIATIPSFIYCVILLLLNEVIGKAITL